MRLPRGRHERAARLDDGAALHGSRSHADGLVPLGRLLAGTGRDLPRRAAARAGGAAFTLQPSGRPRRRVMAPISTPTPTATTARCGADGQLHRLHGVEAATALHLLAGYPAIATEQHRGSTYTPRPTGPSGVPLQHREPVVGRASPWNWMKVTGAARLGRDMKCCGSSICTDVHRQPRRLRQRDLGASIHGLQVDTNTS